MGGRNPCHWYPGRVGTRGMIGADELLCFFVCAKKRMVHSPTYRQTQCVRGDRTSKKKTVGKGGRRSRVVPRFENDALILPSAVESNAEEIILHKTGRSRRQYNSILFGYGFVGPSPPLLAKFCNDILRTTLFSTTTFSLVCQK